MSFWWSNVIILFSGVTSKPPTVPRRMQAHTAVIHACVTNETKNGGTLQSRLTAKKERWIVPGQGQIPGKQTGTMQLS